MKEHDIAQLVNALRDTANKYAGTEQLRENISQIVRAAIPVTPPPVRAVLDLHQLTPLPKEGDVSHLGQFKLGREMGTALHNLHNLKARLTNQPEARSVIHECMKALSRLEIKR